MAVRLRPERKFGILEIVTPSGKMIVLVREKGGPRYHLPQVEMAPENKCTPGWDLELFRATLRGVEWRTREAKPPHMSAETKLVIRRFVIYKKDFSACRAANPGAILISLGKIRKGILGGTLSLLELSSEVLEKLLPKPRARPLRQKARAA